MTLTRWSFSVLSLMVFAGCASFSVKVDREISELASRVDHVEIHPAYDQTTNVASEATGQALPMQPLTQEKTSERPLRRDPAIQPISYLQQEKKPPSRLVIPPTLPGADAPPITKFPEDPVQKKRYLQELFPSLPAAPQLRPIAPGLEGRPMTLADLQRLAAIYSPNIKSAQAAVEAAKGAA